LLPHQPGRRSIAISRTAVCDQKSGQLALELWAGLAEDGQRANDDARACLRQRQVIVVVPLAQQATLLPLGTNQISKGKKPSCYATSSTETKARGRLQSTAITQLNATPRSKTSRQRARTKQQTRQKPKQIIVKRERGVWNVDGMVLPNLITLKKARIRNAEEYAVSPPCPAIDPTWHFPLFPKPSNPPSTSVTKEAGEAKGV